jgi:hypothetical protein
MLRYLLWKGANRTIGLPGILSQAVRLDINGQRDVCEKVQRSAFDCQMTAAGKDELLASVAQALNIDYEDLCRKRLLHIMNAAELRAVKAQGFDIQMHSHRHRVSRKRELFAREIHENRQWIQQTVGGPTPVHFSFPGGIWEPVEREWMTELGIQSAVTGLSALADPRCDRLHLPRFSDDAFVGERAFRAWLSGSMAFFPRAQDNPTQGQILEDTIHVSDPARAFKAGAGR